MTYPLVIELKADGIPVTTSCRVLGFSPQAFYKWCTQPYSDRDWDDAHLVNLLMDLHADDPEFGYRFLTDELHKMGIAVSEGHVQRLCHENQIFSVISAKGRMRPPAGPPAHDDLVKRDFTAEGPNQLWLTDITEHPTAEGKLYLAAVKDVWSTRIVGYSMGGPIAQLLWRRHRDRVDGLVLCAAFPGALTFVAKQELAPQRVAAGGQAVEQRQPRGHEQDKGRAEHDEGRVSEVNRRHGRLHLS